MYQKKVEVKKTLGQTTEDRLMIEPEIVDYCIGKNVPVFPGCISPSEVAQAVKAWS